MNNCSKCKKDKALAFFLENNKKFKTCNVCRNQSRNWRKKNKEVVSLYNKMQIDKKKEKEIYKATECTWEEIKKQHNIENKCKGHPSNHRTLHETIEGVIGKKCCSCKSWHPLVEYNYCKSHWDNLRNDCKKCLKEWRKENRKKLSQKNKEYEKKRKLTDPEFKLVKTLRSRIGTALRKQNSNKNNTTNELLGCSISFLKTYISEKFKDGITWDNHGEWHIDHIKPCASFNLLDDEEQKKCFHYTNLQPLWASENLSKGCRYTDKNNNL
jgi:hypothetical protein